MKKIFFVLALVVFVSSCETLKGYFPSDKTGPSETTSPDDTITTIDDEIEVYESPLSEGNTVDYETESLYEATSSDSISSIARKYGTTRDTIIEMNDIEEPYTLRPGTILKVPTIRTVEKRSNVQMEEPVRDQKIIQIKPSDKKK
jgi:LysM repeat protein